MEEKDSFIGDYLGTIEEFVPGEGTFSEEGKIYAAQIGRAVLDREKHLVKVEGKKLPTIQLGQVIFGEVQQARKSIVSVIATKILGFDEQIKEKVGIYVSNIADKYVEKTDEFFGIGDIVKAKVIKIDGGLIDVSTKSDEYGVVKAFCKRCRKELSEESPGSGKMKCPVCGNKETRKTAKDYGSVEVM